MIQSVSDGHAFEKDKYGIDGMIKYAKAIINHPYFNLINDKKHIGWPGTEKPWWIYNGGSYFYKR